MYLSTYVYLRIVSWQFRFFFNNFFSKFLDFPKIVQIFSFFNTLSDSLKKKIFSQKKMNEKKNSCVCVKNKKTMNFLLIDEEGDRGIEKEVEEASAFFSWRLHHFPPIFPIFLVFTRWPLPSPFRIPLNPVARRFRSFLVPFLIYQCTSAAQFMYYPVDTHNTKQVVFLERTDNYKPKYGLVRKVVRWVWRVRNLNSARSGDHFDTNHCLLW